MKKNITRKIYLATLPLLVALAINAQTNWQLKTEWEPGNGMGTNWSQIDFDASNMNNGIIGNHASWVRRTNNGGATWDSAISTNTYHDMECVKYVAPNTLLGASYGRVYKSTDNGLTFPLAWSFPSYIYFKKMSLDSKGSFVLMTGQGTKGKVFRSLDSGNTFDTLTLFPNNSTIAGIVARIKAESFAYVIGGDTVKFTTDKGATWQTLNLPVAGLYDIDAKNENEWFMYSSSKKYFKTTDKGQTWTDVSAALDKSICASFKPYQNGNTITIDDASQVDAGQNQRIIALPNGEVFLCTDRSDQFYYQRVLYSSDFGNTFSCEKIVDIDSVNSPNALNQAIRLQNLGFRQYGNQLYLLARASMSTTIGNRIYTRNISGGTGIYEEQLNAISIYPNPANSMVTVDNLPNNSTITIADITGRVVHQAKAQSEKTVCNVANYSNGVYFVTVENGANRVSKKLIINK